MTTAPYPPANQYETANGHQPPQGLIRVTPDVAALWLATAPFERQRKVRPAWVATLAETMRSGTFEPTSIMLATCAETGQTYLVDGQHRLSAIVAYGKPVPLYVLRRQVDTFADVAALYGRIDRGLGRSITDVVRAHDVAAEVGIPQAFISRAVGALVFLMSGFGPQHQRKEAARLGDARVHAVREWSSELRALYGAFAEASPGLARRLQSSPVLSVALVTTRYQPEAAIAFWGAVARNDGLRKGQPEHTLVAFLLDTSRTFKADQDYTVRAVAAAWNAAFEGRSVSFLRGTGTKTPIRIAGTPFRGR